MPLFTIRRSNCSFPLAFAVVLGTAALGARVAPAQTVDENLWIPNGLVRAAVQVGDTLYVGGDFSQVQCIGGGGGAVDGTTGESSVRYPLIEGVVNVAVPDGGGGWYVGGVFSRVGGLPRSNLAHIAADQTVLSWNPTPNGAIFDLVVQGGSAYFAGNFTNVGGQGRNFIAAADAVTGDVTPWNPYADDQVTALAANGSIIYAGGFFQNIGGQARNYVAALDAATGVATDWNPNVGPAGFISTHLRDIAVIGSTVYLAGLFDSFGEPGDVRRNIGAVDAVTGLPTSFDPYSDLEVFALVLDGSTVYAGGDFSDIGGQTRNYLAALDAASGLATAWNPSGFYKVRTLAIAGSTLYVGGQAGAAALSTVTASRTSWDPAPDLGDITALAVDGSSVYVGGNFISIGGMSRHNIAAFDLTSGFPTSWNPNASWFVSALEASGSNVYAGGWFETIGGASRICIAALDRVTGLATPWNPSASSVGVHHVDAIKIKGSIVYVGGTFRTIGGESREGLAAVDIATGLARPWNPNPDYYVTTLALGESVVYAGGGFHTIGGQPRRFLAALNPVGTAGNATSWRPDPDNIPAAIAADQVMGTVYVGGDFHTVGGKPRNYLAALSPTTGQATDWNPGVNSQVKALALAGSRLFAGGIFTLVGSDSRPFVAELDRTTGVATAWRPNPDNWVTALALGREGTVVYMSGLFRVVAGVTHPKFASVSITVPAAAPDPDRLPGFALLAPAPNPAFGAARIDYQVGREAPVRIGVFDVQGREVARLVDGLRPAGIHSVAWNGSAVSGRAPAGLYFVRYETTGWSASRRLVRVR